MSNQIVISTGVAQSKLDKLASTLAKPRPLFRAIAGILKSDTEANVAAQGRPSWVPLAESTKAARLKRNKGSSVLKILKDSGTLASSVSTRYGVDYALVGASTPYAAAQQLNGSIKRIAKSTKLRLRTDAKGNLLRQAKNDKLAVFAKDTHKRARETWAEIGAHTINIPARPYLPFKGTAQAGALQPENECKVLDLVTAMLSESLN
jgi:phage virion morphogenesis protein